MRTKSFSLRATAPRFAGLAFALALSACGGFNGHEEAELGVSYVHPITVTADDATLTIPASRERSGLSDDDRKAIGDFASAYKERGHGPLTVSTPSGSPNTTTAMNVLVDVRDALSDTGIAAGNISYLPYNASAKDGDAPVILSFKRYVAKAAPCGDWSMDYDYDPNNVLPPNHGCASQNNLAALVADPADLVQPRAMTPSDGDRRQMVLDKYRKGEITATQRDDHDSAAVSEVNK
ncbi:MAG TPA: CpaD family pilus assembly protein [Parvibaculum sp.]